MAKVPTQSFPSFLPVGYVLAAIAVLAFSLGSVQAQMDPSDINTATQQELKAVKGIGAANAKKIDRQPVVG